MSTPDKKGTRIRTPTFKDDLVEFEEAQKFDEYDREVERVLSDIPFQIDLGTPSSSKRKSVSALSGSGSRASSAASNSSRSSSLNLSEYFRNLLFAQGVRNKNIGMVEDLFPGNPQLQEKVEEIRDRDALRVATESPQDNMVRASLVCYKKGDFEGSFREIKIIPLATPLDSAETKRAILDIEMREAREMILARQEDLQRQRNDLLGRAEEKLEEIAALEALCSSKDPLSNIHLFLKKLIASASVFSTILQRAKESENSLQDALRTNSITVNAEEDPLKSLESKLITKLKANYPGRRFAIQEEETLEDVLERARQALEEKEKDYANKIEDADYLTYKALERELKKCEALLQEEELKKIVTLQRGHSEDYLLNSLQQKEQQDYLRAGIGGGECDRFYLIVSSTRDSCNRCSLIVEKISDLLRDVVNPERDPKIICKTIYFATRGVTTEQGTSFNREYDHAQETSVSEDEAVVFNILPTRSASKSTTPRDMIPEDSKSSYSKPKASTSSRSLIFPNISEEDAADELLIPSIKGAFDLSGPFIHKKDGPKSVTQMRPISAPSPVKKKGSESERDNS